MSRVEESARERTIAQLEARVAGLEAALERRSRELELIQRHVCRRDLLVIARLRAGLPPLPHRAHEPSQWQETTALTPVEVEEAVTDLWSSLAVSAPAR